MEVQIITEVKRAALKAIRVINIKEDNEILIILPYKCNILIKFKEQYKLMDHNFNI